MTTILERLSTASRFATRLVLLMTVSCGVQHRPEKAVALDPDEAYRRIQDLRHTHEPAALAEAEKAYQASRNTKSPSVAAERLRLLYAQVLIDEEHYDKVESLLGFAPKTDEIRTRQLAAIAYFFFKKESRELSARMSAFVLENAQSVDDDCWKAEFLINYSRALVWSGDEHAPDVLGKAGAATDKCKDQYWTAYKYVVWGSFYGRHFRFQQELDSALRASRLENEYKFTRLIGITNGNIALAYFHLGDSENAQTMLNNAERWYASDNEDLAIDIGHRARVEHFSGDDTKSINDYNKALAIARSVRDKSVYLRNLQELATILLDSGNLEEAESKDLEALKDANLKTDRWQIYTAQLNEARIARLKGQPGLALDQFRSIGEALKQETLPYPDLVWRMHSEMAETLTAIGREQQADREFRIAIETAYNVRKNINNDWRQMTFSVYLQKLVALYIDALVKRKDGAGSLQIVETFRAQRLTEKLHSGTKPAPQQFRKIAAARSAVILSYWINGDQSYLWATTGKEIKVFRLQGMQTLENELAELDIEIGNSRNLLENPKPYIDLFRKLVKPAEGMIPRDANVIVVPDGPLGRLNFEMLIPDTQNTPPAYWINQLSTLDVAPSLALLRNESTPPKNLQRALLAGDPIAKNKEPELSEIQHIKPLFSEPVVLTGASATPKRFLDTRPGQFAVLHVSAHAFANRESPLDSFIQFTDGNMYAHDLMGLQLKEDLVTLSACQGAKGRNLPGEGVVSLTWAILSAGARNVIASAPNVPVQTTREFMKDFYARLKGGATPGKALHDTKVALAAKQPAPYYWAGFQLYTR